MAHKQQCPKCASKGLDKSCNNLHVYGETLGAYCFSCGFTVLSDAEKEARGIDAWEWEEDEITTKELLTSEEAKKIKEYTGTKGQNSRGISDATYNFYGCRFEYDTEDGSVTKHYYPVTEGYAAGGYKIRILPKDFSSVGKIGKDSDLFGQYKFKNASGKYVLITAGEIDCMSGYQMLEDYRKSRGSDFQPTPVVSSVIGESGSHKQIKAHYEWLNRFERIVICYDNDEAGKKAIHELAKVIPKGKMYVMELTLKDTNKYLEEGKAKDWIDRFFKAKAYTPAGILGSGELSAKMREEVAAEKIKFPPFMYKVNEMTAGGLSLGKICNIGAASGLGKTVYVDSIVYYLIFNSPHKVGVVSMELSAPQYGISMLSRHIGKKISNIQDREECVAFMNSPEVIEAENELLFCEDGTHRWYLVDDRDGSIEDLKEVVERLVISCECKLIVLDPLQDCLDGLTNEEQALFLKWQKGLIKSHGVSFININHVRKSGGGGPQNSNGAMISEEDFAGSSTIFKSAALNILLVRDKMNEDPFVRNVTKAYISKNRDNGITGPCGEYYYDNNSHQLWDKDEWLAKNGGSF